MIETLDNSVIWFCIGFIFFVLEFMMPGFILFFFGIGAWVVAIVSFFTDITINTQIIIFISSSLFTVVLLRSWIKRKLGKADVNSKQLEDEFIGKIAKAETSIIPGSGGKVEFKGTSWDASSNDIISAGENVMITETKSILLIVRSLKTL
ncbi:NfeD family protein [Pedobacter metabolipauper]|uniref:Membrane protein implicated in regulation of membrane protease activity n=1 Tax=Pedobacter metabolipauper TaxID=425513 RepID=A0A4R6SUP9_9SPHI|nr:NfeD family protein [Pedobacter metabolipauper]TDQ09470.1 membrane protein implicated in regulation of membrane protease activity [Pedobacter metabolipauper]